MASRTRGGGSPSRPARDYAARRRHTKRENRRPAAPAVRQQRGKGWFATESPWILSALSVNAGNRRPFVQEGCRGSWQDFVEGGEAAWGGREGGPGPPTPSMAVARHWRI